MDATDRKALAALLDRGRMTWAELGELLGLSPPAAAERVHRLEERGVIRGFTAMVDPDAAGYPVLAFVFVTLENQSRRAGFLEAIRGHGAILECHHVAGEDDYLLKVRCPSMKQLDQLLSNDLKTQLGVARTRTTIILGTAKETSKLLIEQI
ncbi:MAG: Lrp/AsnC family transcriptional regulator [Acidobacteria bacterium]|nr:Lrp/AsnC family transcriptional regulator [Acidobacteriota bacterium]